MKRICLFVILLCQSILILNAVSYNITDFGAVSGKFLNTDYIQAAIDSCHRMGGGKVIIPVGKFCTGTLYLRSNVFLELMPGAILQGSDNPLDYSDYDISAYKKIGTIAQRESYVSTVKSLIIADNVHNVGICGEGAINGAGSSSVFQLGMNKAGRPKNICFLNSSHIRLSGVTISNAAEIVVSLSGCVDVVLERLHIKSLVNWNNDGLDIDAKNVLVSDCIIESEDDALCLKSEYADRLCENIVVQNCIVSSICNGIKLGTGSRGGFRNITVTNCVINRTDENGFRHWDMPSDVVLNPNLASVNTGIVVMGVDGGIVEDIKFSNIIMNDVLSPFFIRVGKRAVNAAGKPSVMKNITLSNIQANVRSVIPSVIAGIDDSRIENIHLSDICIHIPIAVNKKRMKDYPVLVVENAKGYPENRITFGTKIPFSTFYLKNIDGVFFRGIHVYHSAGEVRKPFGIEKVDNIFMNDIYVNNCIYDINKDN